ncbi:cysteine desulfurase (Nitrogenase metalloclustersbiosynthesis protein NifS) [Sulfurihydrogenibium azorense Az-Fu1]|uniref:Cysteine desulfurase (Nitrogenase metalloclustersbiosynthesis protein NifS) n=1 Tax=Sulfurihydrogenibium azorense (strain DSM 15241 / OCM 825 / Az-Fu1) TaxID=204536 RepID=C1DX31_SULAA|nr:cysteine desulfurase family protein [Sulfurihydrogenibium azorense]ACN98945.1 cysteine desulfurase (Nitrogenase metalloclustersbiosynthesis protein NifS) [Sulfurihydrogenibium azorense Az-Fu1]
MIYFDNAATSPVLPEILDSLKTLYEEYYANPSSIHKEGQKARNLIEKSRYGISQYIGCNADEIIFTSCATESNNLAIIGLAESYPEKDHIITTPIEHKSVLMPLKHLSSKGYKVDFVKVDKNGIVDLDHLKSLINNKTLLVCVIHGNNETGVLQDLENIGKVCKEKDVFFFTDVVQSFCKEDIPLQYIDMFSISGHKINAPKSIGMLYKKEGIKLTPIIFGGGQERGLRSGTESPQLIHSLFIAIEYWNKNKDRLVNHLKSIKDLFEEKLTQSVEEIEIVSKDIKRLPNISNIIFPKIDAQSLIMALDTEGVAVSSGSACSSGTPTPSHVLKAYGYTDKQALSSIRFSFGIFNTVQEVEVTVEKITNIYRDLRSFF